jgi:hypothetical protein
MKLEFIKTEEDYWFIVLPDYPGLETDKQMVSGADTLLDMIDKGNTGSVSLDVNLEMPNSWDLKLTHMFNLTGGATYWYTGIFGMNFPVWLCKVTKYVFNGKLPKIIYATAL